MRIRWLQSAFGEPVTVGRRVARIAVVVVGNSQRRWVSFSFRIISHPPPPRILNDFFFLARFFVLFVNPVNVRLMGERLERNAEKEPNQWESQQARWPSLYACPNCWRDDRSWEDEEVFKFLRSSYWSGNPSYLKIPPPGDDGSVDGRSRMVPLRWKLAAVVFATVALILHMYNTKRKKQYSGKHKK